MQNLFIFIGIIWCINLTWEFQINFGNYLKHTRPKSKLRWIWWSMCDNDGICDFCDSRIPKSIWGKYEKVDIKKSFSLYNDNKSSKCILVNDIHLYWIEQNPDKSVKFYALNKMALMYGKEYFQREDYTGINYFFDKEKMCISGNLERE